jgi:DNA (cytosine-5)-methyltransferase 1
MAKRNSTAELKATTPNNLIKENSHFRDRLTNSIISAYSDNPSFWWKEFLTDASYGVSKKSPSDKISVLDLFSSVGGLSLGASVAAKTLGRSIRFEGASDTDSAALQVHSHNFGTRHLLHESVRDLVDFRVTTDTADGRARFRYSAMCGQGEHLGDVNLLIGGPPCQGHSTLNNQTRSDDPKNELMLTMPAIAVAMGIPAVIIENVPNVINDSKNVVKTTRELFENNGYSVSQGVMSANQLGWPQTRKRFFMVARLDGVIIDFEDIVTTMKMQSQPISWAISDLIELCGSSQVGDADLFNSVPQLSSDNVRRIKWLFDNNEFDLPNHERPKCHQNGHTYPATYGRMSWDKPAPTITTGFLTPGRGRFIHPIKPRVLTPHEAARIQGFPDWFDFCSPLGKSLSRSNLTKWIGDAVPSVLGAAAVIGAIG